MSEIVEHDHYPEIAENDMAWRRLELMGLDEQLAEPTERRQFFSNLDDEGFQRMSGYINSVVRHNPIEYDYQDGTLGPVGSDTPPLDDKKPLMDMTFQAIRNIMADPNFNDQEALQRAGLTYAGAVNYIHPYDNGNGRAGRIGHYLIEFGTERGKEAFGEEIYAAIGKLPVYDVDTRHAIDDSPRPELETALNNVLINRDREGYVAMNGLERASTRVSVFLDMMQGSVTVPIEEKTLIYHPNTMQKERFEAGEIDGLDLYRMQYLAMSEVPNRAPQDVPDNAKRVMAEKPSKDQEYISLPVDIL